MFKSLKTNAIVNGLIERTSSMLDEMELKTVHKEKQGDREKKKK